MSRRLVAVALLPSGRLAARIDGLRDALGDPRRGDLPSHLTLVPPIDLDDSGAAQVHAALRSAASEVAPFTLQLGPAATFAPRTSTLHLAVRGDLDELVALRYRLRREPWDRPDEHDFVPHVTLLQRATSVQVDQGTGLLAAEVGDWPVHSVHLLERLRPDSGAVWHPVAEEPLGGPRVVGRGGVELHLRVTSTLEPAMAELMGWEWATTVAVGPPLLVASADQPGRPGRPIGVAVGRADAQGAVLEHLAVAPEQRRQGIARQLVGAWCDAAVSAGAGVVAVRPSAPGDARPVVEALGFRPVDATTWCRRVGPLGELGSAR